MSILGDLIDIAIVPIKIGVAVTGAIVNPVAEIAKEIVEEINSEY